MADDHAAAIASELSKSTGVAQADVHKVLDKLGISASLAAVGESGGGTRVQASHAKLAFRVGKNLIAV